jgi:putative membrane protein
MHDEKDISPSPSAAPSAPSEATILARDRTDLAMNRSFLAAERTLMAWIRTSLSMISFGFTLAKLGQAMHDVELKRLLGGVRIVGVRRMGYYLVVLGTMALFAAAVQHWNRMRKLRAMGLHYEFSITLLVALLLVIVGALAFTSLVANV